MIISHGLIGKEFTFKLLEDDGGSWVGDTLRNRNYHISSDKTYVDVVLKEIPKSLGDDHFEGNVQELFAYIEIVETKNHLQSDSIDVDAKVLNQDPPEGNKVAKVGEVEITKEKFEKVKDKAEEAVIYISSEIATEIKVDKNGKIISFPDSGKFNGQDEYIENGKIYCKKISNALSAFPTFKAYIYRGNTKGEAIKKLKQDIKFKTHENAESTILEIARHSRQNLNYKQSGPIPPNTIDKLYRLNYKEGTTDGKTTYRYRIVDDIVKNFPVIQNYKKEYVGGSMSIGNRSAISIDPWQSKGLEGCIGLRGLHGAPHSSCRSIISNQDAANCKYIYHSINNYLEGIIPELAGVYGRRGYSTNTGTVLVSASTYDHEVTVFVLVDHLTDIDGCGLFNDNRRLYYKSFGTKTIKYLQKNSTANKFKGLYMIAQRRQENGFNLKTIGNNPMNIKGRGDLGQISMNTHETINGNYVSVSGEMFANFSSEDAGFTGYVNLLKNNFNDAYLSFFDDEKTINDFTAGLEDTGKIGAYATGKANGQLSATDDYKAKVKANFDTTKRDYIKIYECLISKAMDQKIKKQLEDDLILLQKLE